MNNTILHNIQQTMQHQRDALQQKVLQAWETHLAPKYHALEEREQYIVRLAAILLPLIIFVFGMLLPAADKNTQLHAEIKAFSSQVAEAEQLAKQLAAQPQNQSKGNPSSNNMLTQVDNLARKTGVRSFMTRLRPQQVMGSKPRLQAQIKNAPYAKVASFLTALANNNLPVSQIKIQAVSPGLVHVQTLIGGS
ncbi:MAG: type II secretion system protein GspM [Ghiorsea sp.]